MKALVDLLDGLDYDCIQGRIDVNVTDIVNDSRKVTEGSLFLYKR